MPLCTREELGSDSKEKQYVKRDRRHGKSSNYNIKVDILNFYGSMHVEEFLDQILTVDNLFEYMDIPQEKWVRHMAFNLKRMASAWWQHVESKKSYRKEIHQVVAQNVEDDERVLPTRRLPAATVFQISEPQVIKS